MPAHDLPYVEPAGGQNSEASSVAKAFSLGPVAGDSLAGGMPLRAGHRRRVVTRHPGAPARCPAAGSGAARVRRWWQVARLPRARAARRGHGPGGRHLPCHRHGRAGPSPPGTGGSLRGTGRSPVPIRREWPVRAWARQAPSHV